MQTPSRRLLTVGVAALLVVVIAAAGYVNVSNDQPTELTVENQRNATYQLTVFQNSADSRADMGFAFTTDDGTQQYGGLDDIETSPRYQNTTLVDAERSTQITVTAGENATETLEAWNNGEATAYIVETPEEELLYAEGIHCDGGDHTFYLQFRADGSILSSSQCR
jgi:hypothetical protein